MNRLGNEAGGALTEAQVRVLEAEWDRLVQQAALWAHLRLLNGSETAAQETRRLLRRLRERKTEILRFLREPHVPFNNNLAERDLRMAKTKEKISGTFRSEAGVEAFCLMRSVLSTIQKQKKPVAETMVELLQGNTEALFA
ncbi:transposase [Geobacillus sp. AYS3]|uniref:IS66 family transposase n=1 Tax=Geobacillus sp. AYS3 TaxID=2603623 RepID=UPI0011CA260B|nr:transposase [Geobacillus sp. AYS3]TXK89006.1 transposase [Geobacillus sp. AYS3]